MVDDSDDDDNAVAVVPWQGDHPDGVRASGSPNFIIRHRGVLYWTEAVQIFDMNKTDDESQKNIVRAMTDYLEENLDREENKADAIRADRQPGFETAMPQQADG